MKARPGRNGFVNDRTPPARQRAARERHELILLEPGRRLRRIETLMRAAKIGVNAGLRYVYAGNLPGLVTPYEHTCCPACKTAVIEREGYTILTNRLVNGACPQCRTTIPGIWH